MVDNEEKAVQLLQEANKKLGPWVLGGVFTGSKKTEEALELLNRAANQFKMAKNWTEAGNTFSKIASHHSWRRNKHEAATNFVAAANCYRKKDSKEAISYLQKAIDIYLDMGRFSMVAKHHQIIAELYEAKDGDLDKAMKHYEMAAEYFKGEDSNSSAKKCMLKIAEISAQFEKYETAIQIYDQVALEALESRLLKYGAKDYFFRASICHLGIDVINADKAVKRYIDQYPAFGDSREAKLIQMLCKSIEDQDLECFEDTVKKYDSLCRLDKWFHNILQKVKEHIPDEINLC